MTEKKTTQKEIPKWQKIAGGISLGFILVVILLALSNGNPEDNINTEANNTENATELANQPKGLTEPLVFSGSGVKPTDSFDLPSGGYRVTLNFSGEGNFIVNLVDANGELVYNLSNEIDSVELTKVISVTSGKYFLAVENGSGEWTIKIELL